MKVIVTNKGEGFVAVRYEAESPIEGMMLSTCPLDSAETSVEIRSDTSTDWTKTPPLHHKVARLTFNGFAITCHDILQGTDKPKPR